MIRRSALLTLAALGVTACGGLPGPGAPTPAPTIGAPTSVPSPTFSPASPTSLAQPTPATTAVAAAEATPTGPISQFRAFWVDAFHPGIKSPAEVDRLIEDVRAAGANAIFVQVRRRGDAYFARRIEPRTEDPDLVAGFDPLDDLLQKARATSPILQVHAWVASLPIWRGDKAPPKDPAHVYHQHGPTTTGADNWLSWNHEGKQFDGENYSLDPGHPAAADYTLRVVSDIARQYPVDGLHLDLIRYAQKQWGYNPTNVDRFNRLNHRSGLPAIDDPTWADWRRAQVTALVRRVYLELQTIRPAALLSAALIPWGHGPADEAAWKLSPPYAWTFQDWHSWLAEGILDLGVPMAYFQEGDPRYIGAWDEWTKDALAHQGRRRVAMGAGLYLNTIADSIGQIIRAIERGATGISLYSYATFNRNESTPRSSLREALAASGGPFAVPALPPELSWKTSAPEAHLSGTIVDASGQPLDGATIRLSGPESRPLQSDGSGAFGAIALTPGSYKLEVQPGGLSREVVVRPGQISAVQLSLS